MTEIKLTYQPGISLAQIISFEIAGQIWSQLLTDAAVVNIHIATTADLPPRVLGGALPSFVALPKYNDFRKALVKDRTSLVDNIVSKEMQSGSDFDIAVNIDGTHKKLEDLDRISLSRANAKSLGIINGKDAGLDGLIVIRNSLDAPYQWNYNTTGAPAATTVDFLSVALHEIGHILGFTSGVDASSWRDFVVKKRGNTQRELDGHNLTTPYATPLDLLRYSPTSVGAFNEIPDLSIGGTSDKFFSIDGGQASIASFASGKDITFSRGYQASHWDSSQTSVGLMDAAIRLGQRMQFTRADLTAFDAIGWNLSSTQTNLFSNLAGLETQATQAIASRLGVSTAWLADNATSAASRLTQDRTQDVTAMLETTEAFTFRRGGGGRSWQELWQELVNVFHQEALFDTFSFPSTARQGTSRRDILRGTQTNDTLLGVGGSDRLVGRAGDDLLNGGKGNDKLFGGSGVDWLIGGANRDIFVGGAGSDVFVIENYLNQADWVKDFNPKHDKLHVGAGLSVDQLAFNQIGKNTSITLKESPLSPLIWLANTDATSISASTFI